MELEEVDFSLRDCLEDSLRTLALQADEKGIELLCDIAANVPETLQGDMTRLRQVILNLVGNAVKFTAAGEVGIRVEMEDGESEIRNFHFTVTDTGIGIAPEKREAIFHPFTQADTSTTRHYGGTGLGLTICARLVSMMGGNIWFESELGRGSQFHFTVPMKVSGEGGVEPGIVIPAGKLRGMRALIVDDNATNRRILLELLKRWELRACAVESGEQALAELLSARAAGDAYRLILTDMHMPRMDGFEFIERVRDTAELSMTTMMMLTSAGYRNDKARCSQLGIAAYLLKPIRKWELLAAILEAVDRVHPGSQPATDARLNPAPAAGSLHVLLAEDNHVNQVVAIRNLEKLGHSVVVANNGLEALSWLDRQAFDLVLMDIQMPEMDGLTATKTIRAGEREGGSRIPIIAMTAHAMKGDRERCLEGGMDGYVSKPISSKALEEAIASAVHGGAATRTGSGNPVPGRISSWDAGLVLAKLDGNEKLFHELLEIFREESPKNLDQLREAISHGDSETVANIAHTLKGELGYFGMSGVCEHARELEEMGRRHELEGAAGVSSAMEAEILAVLNAMQNLNSMEKQLNTETRAIQ